MIFIKDSRTEEGKIIYSFISLSVIIISGILISLGVVTARNNTMTIDSGIKPAMIYAQRENEQISVTIGKKLFESDGKDIINDTVLQLLPVPFGGAYIIYQNAVR